MVKFLGLYDPWGSFLDFAPSVHEAPRACKRRTTLRDKATGKGREGVKPLPISRDERGFCISARDLNALGLEALADLWKYSISLILRTPWLVQEVESYSL